MSTPSIQTLITQAQQVLNLKSSNEIRATLAAVLANANVGTPLNPNLTTQQLWDEFYEIVRQPSDDIMSIITDQMMRMVFTPPAPGGAGADKQVIFNDAGVLAGDAGLVYNKTTDTLTAGAAAITGDLTVDTNVLKVDSTNNRVGIGLVSPNRNLSIFGATNSLIHFTTTATGPLNTDGFTFGVETDSSVTLFNAENTPFNFYVNSTLGMTLNSTGLGIGDSPSYKLHVAKTTDGTVGYFRRISGTINPALTVYCNETGNTVGFGTDYAGATSPSITFTTGGAERVRVDASGNLLVGTTDATQTSGVGTKILGSGLGPYVVNAATANSALAYTMYSTGAAAYRFYVGWAGTVFATNTTISAISDARLKENVQNLDVGLNEILALKPRKFDWKAGKGKDIKGDRGFIAQEFETVFPNLIDEWADPAPEGEAPYKSVRQDLIPVLVKAIQELTARVQTLEAR